MAKNWTIQLMTHSVSISEGSLSPSNNMFVAPLNVGYVQYLNAGQYDTPGHEYVNIKLGTSTFKLDLTADAISPAVGTNSAVVYCQKLGRYINGDSGVTF